MTTVNLPLILAVDDEASNLQLLRQILQDHYRLRFAKDGQRALELVRVRDMTAYVKRASSSRGAMPQWAGSKMPLSSELADAALVITADHGQVDVGVG